jgi:hypothetical protein
MDWRNPFEDFRDKYLSFAPVTAYKLFLIRWGYIPYFKEKVDAYDARVKKVWGDEIPPEKVDLFMSRWDTYRDMGVEPGIQTWITKFYNARFSFHIGVSIWKGWLPLPFLGLVIRRSLENYFQAGIGFGPEGKHDNNTNVWERATICGKLRTASFKEEWHKGGNTDVYGYYEGTV